MENHSVLDAPFGGKEVQLVPASKGKRLANYILDIIGFYLCMMILGFFMGVLFPDSFNFLDNPANNILLRLVSLFLFALYYVFFELVGRGKTPGKWITGTRAVNEQGFFPGFPTILGRSFARIIPFEPLSFFGSSAGGWHDSMSSTMVVDERKSALPDPEAEL